MKFNKLIMTFFFFIATTMFAETKEVDKLFEKVNQAPTPEEKKELIEELKKKLAQKNIKAREEADAIIKAKQKIPLKPYNDSSLKK
ncbi:hypothetical protein [Arcobacter sp. LA11]|uniref:hypothetical protein n=1 Tax=Arcobacter sp. LA11 TaxID=1898176 RepID=UPI000934890E|nr:hypothetical protein [Arcobacter sp. LA11]